MATPKLKVAVYRDNDRYVAQCLDANISSDGNTEAEALDNLNEALELYAELKKKTKLRLAGDAS